MKELYANLFQCKDNKILDINFTETFKNYPITKMSESEASSLDGPLYISELSAVLKTMKNNKTPGVEGKLSVSLCQFIINCIPKGDKNREFF